MASFNAGALRAVIFGDPNPREQLSFIGWDCGLKPNYAFKPTAGRGFDIF